MLLGSQSLAAWLQQQLLRVYSYGRGQARAPTFVVETKYGFSAKHLAIVFPY
ncbi:hypothetical protein J2W69_002564 [Rheinheimera soli]|jgi:hypothetical protein|uniref:Uncharacterized protein n=1 Tax=Rheinheimera soli TaxID=443616 RepID=A0ABU1W103_9GAMM|nr:hypothetical protein [Rheinheimera soli]